MTDSDCKKNHAGSTGMGIVIAVILIAVSFFVGRHLGTGPQSQVVNPMAAMANMVVSVSAAPAAMVFVDNPREYVGYVEAINTVDLCPQVNGYLEIADFTEGAFVEAGKTLFTIEQGQYKATLELRKAQLAQAQADLSQSEKYLKRLMSADGRSVSQNDIDSAESIVAGNKARIQQCQAGIELAEIDLKHTVIKAPISGYIGRAEVTAGNYVSSSTPYLARIVQTDPVRVVFSLPDKEYLDSLNKIGKGGDDSSVALRLRLPDGSEYSAVGKSEFANNEMDPQTATIAIRFRFDNADKKLVPGGYVTVLLGDAQRQKSLVVPHSAILNTAEGTSVYVVDAESNAQLRHVVIGDETETGAAIVSGLSEGEMIIVQGLQKVRPGAKVKVD